MPVREIKTRHVPTLAYLLLRGARHNHVRVTTAELGHHISKSQQAASDHLRELERDGLIKRTIQGRSLSIKVTPRGYAGMARLYESLRSCIESAPASIELTGTLVSGSGEGRYYMAVRGYTSQFRTKIGYVPFPGTLNVRLDVGSIATLADLDSIRGTLIDGFSDGERTYGWVRCHPATINSHTSCDLLRLERTHHDDSIVELVAGVNLRRKLRISDGSDVVITVVP